jgi:hypothetical protein
MDKMDERNKKSRRKGRKRQVDERQIDRVENISEI